MKGLVYFVACLKTLAFLTAIFELFPEQKRHKLEAYFKANLTFDLLISMSCLLAGFYISIWVFGYLAPYLPIVVFVIVSLLKSAATMREDFVESIIAWVIWLAVFFIFPGVIGFITDDSWSAHLTKPINYLFSLPLLEYLSYLAPPIDAVVFADQFKESINNKLLEASGDNLITGLYIKVGLGYLNLLLILITCALYYFVYLLIKSVVFLPGVVLMQLSQQLKIKLKVDGTSLIPFAGFLLLIVAEFLSFAIASYNFF